MVDSVKVTLLKGFDQMHELGKLLILKNGNKLRGNGELHSNHRTHITMGDKRRHRMRQLASVNKSACTHPDCWIETTESVLQGQYC
jgi:hypothetical protein